MTEPEAGSDLRGMKTNAKKDGDDWVINGTKHLYQMLIFLTLFILLQLEQMIKEGIYCHVF